MKKHSLKIRRIKPEDLLDLSKLVREFHKFEGIRSKEAQIRTVLKQMVSDPSAGTLWLACRGIDLVGYCALMYCFSIEYGGWGAMVDEIYLKESERGKGLGKRLLEHAIRAAEAEGVRALHLEVDKKNRRAQLLYSQLGFEAGEHGHRNFLTLRL